MKEERDYYQELTINTNNLEQEWISHSEKAQYWCVQAAKAQTELKTMEMNKEILKATLYRKYRTQLEDEGKKVTEAMIESYVITDPEYNDLKKQLIIAEENASILDSARWNFQARKTSLEKIQEGILQGLFADPRDSVDKQRMKETIQRRRS